MSRLELVGLGVIGLITVGAGLALFRYGERARPLAIVVALLDLAIAGFLLVG